MNPFTSQELENIEKIKEKNNKSEELLSNNRVDWNKKLVPLFKVLEIREITDSNNAKNILDAQSSALTYKQLLYDQINYFLNERGKISIRLKKLKQDKFIFYATGFPIKTNLGEKGILIDAHTAEMTRSIELIESYIEFLRETVRNLDSFGYSIKNMIELFNYLGR